jgi:S-adenosylmethionine synthetase
MILIFGEISSTSTCDYQRIVRNTVKEIGYNDSKMGESGLFYSLTQQHAHAGVAK